MLMKLIKVEINILRNVFVLQHTQFADFNDKITAIKKVNTSITVFSLK